VAEQGVGGDNRRVSLNGADGAELTVEALPLWPVFAAARDGRLAALLAGSRRGRYRRGEVVFHEGDVADTVHVIDKGHVAIQVITEDGDTVIYRVLGPGEVFGELALQSGQVRRYGNAVALEPTETRVLDADQLRQRCLTDPGTTQAVIDFLALQVRSLAASLVEALFVPVETRVLRRLAAMSRVYGDGTAGTVIPLTQATLADLAGTSRATVNRVLKQLEDANITSRRRAAVVVRDHEALAWAAARAAPSVSRT
jgi:CRP-like cAMP-binding protein